MRRAYESGLATACRLIPSAGTLSNSGGKPQQAAPVVHFNNHQSIVRPEPVVRGSGTAPSAGVP